MTKTVLVTGGTGKVGGALLDSLLQQSATRVRALVRDAAKAEDLAKRGIDTVVGSFENPSAIEQAVRGVDVLALITSPCAQAFEQAARVIEIATQAGVRKVVRLSASQASEEGHTDNSRQHGRIERAISESGMSYVFLRPQSFMQNLLGSVASVVGEGKLYAGVAEGKIAMIDARDVASSMTATMLSDAFNGRALELTGPESLSHETIAVELGNVLERQVAYVPVPPDVAGEAMRAFGADDWLVRLVADYSRAHASGFGDFVTGEVQAVTGRPPRTLRPFAREVFLPIAKTFASAKNGR
jgi:uncharacterized protein YbjT (DUF2867 family)